MGLLLFSILLILSGSFLWWINVNNQINGKFKKMLSVVIALTMIFIYSLFVEA